MAVSPVETRLFAAVLAFGLALAMGCDGTGDARSATGSRPVAAPGERTLPRFEGRSLDGKALGSDVFRRKRGIVFLFSESDQGADTLAGVVERAAADASGKNIAFLGISRDEDADRGRAFARRHGLDFPILADPSRQISRKLRAAQPEAAVIVVDGEGYMVLAYAGIEEGVGAETSDQVTREALRMESAADAVVGSLGVRPDAPDFSVVGIEGGTLSLAELRGEAVIVMFFLHTCPHCHDALRFLRLERAALGADSFRIVAISVQNRPDDVRRMGSGLELDFSLYLDPDGSAQRAYAHTSAVPDTVILDREHRVVGRHGGFEPRIEALIGMSIREAIGAANPILLVRDGYSGADTCTVCHSSQHSTWSLTNHAYAFDTLVDHGENRNPECLPCHTVGWEEKGGYTPETPRAYLEGVQCESCHGRGGPHQTPDFVAEGFEKVCLSCHTAEHSLRFEFAKRLPLVSHAANLQFAELSVEERRKLLERRDKRERQLFDEATYVGSQRCETCHAKEYERWSQSQHASAFSTLKGHDEQANRDCQRCHTTGFERAGGFPDGGSGFEDVGCESCHGPGGNHAGPDDRKDGTILALTDKCDSCVVLQICGSCHDDANDPGFEFEVLDKIDLIRHGFRDREAGSAAE